MNVSAGLLEGIIITSDSQFRCLDLRFGNLKKYKIALTTKQFQKHLVKILLLIYKED